MNVEDNKKVSLSKEHSFAIWGSCVTREIFNYIDGANITTYILQNPIHTCSADAYEIAEDKIQNRSRCYS